MQQLPPLVDKMVEAFDQEYGEDRCGWGEVTKHIDSQVIKAIARDIRTKMAEADANYISFNELIRLLILTYKLTTENAYEFYSLIVKTAGMLEVWDYGQTDEPYYITPVQYSIKNPFEA